MRPRYRHDPARLIATAVAVTIFSVSSAQVGPGGPPPSTASIGTELSGAANAVDVERIFVLNRRQRAARLPAPPPIPLTGVPAFNEIDRFLGAAWEAEALRAGQPLVIPEVCDDATFVRRAYLDVIGVIPTIDEARRFVSSDTADKRSRLIDELLARSEDYADHWTPFWEDALVSSPVGVNAGMATRGNYTAWIREAFVQSRAFDLFAAELLDPRLPRHKPAEYGSDNGAPRRVHYVLNESHTDTLQTAAGVAQVFMGTAMKCASCHNHFENTEWPQERFLSFAGLFGERDLEMIRCEKRSGVLAKAHFPFEVPGAPTEIPAGVPDRLAHVAQLLVDPLNPRFATTVANRLWKRYLGLGLFEPADDYREEWGASHPELLEWLAQDLIRHDYDLKRTIRLILNSRTYQLRYDPSLEDRFDAAVPAEPRWFRSPALRRLTAEQVLDSVRVATTQRLDPASRSYHRTAPSALTRALGKPSVRNDVTTSRADDTAVLQGLELLNGDEYQGLTRTGELVAMAAAVPSVDGVIDAMYRAALSRSPTDGELTVAREFIGPDVASITPGPAVETIWIDDALPLEHGYTHGDWLFVDSVPAHRGGKSIRIESPADGRAQNHVVGLADLGAVGADDVLVVHVYLDTSSPPREVMVQWNDGGGNDGGWAHRAYWGESLIPFGKEGTSSRRRAGDLPKPGEWTRLEIPATDVGLDAAGRVTGISLDAAGGIAHFDAIGIVRRQASPATERLHDLLWALFTSPEFHYVH